MFNFFFTINGLAYNDFVILITFKFCVVPIEKVLTKPEVYYTISVVRWISIFISSLNDNGIHMHVYMYNIISENVQSEMYTAHTS